MSLLPILLANFCPCPVASCPQAQNALRALHYQRSWSAPCARGGTAKVTVRVSAESVRRTVELPSAAAGRSFSPAATDATPRQTVEIGQSLSAESGFDPGYMLK